MIWHVGLLYRIDDLMQLIDRSPITRTTLLNDFATFHGVSIQQLIDIALIGKWVQQDSLGNLFLTSQGRDLILNRDPNIRLRRQVCSLVRTLNPPWISVSVQGRKAFSRYAPAEAVQCFREANMLDSLEEEVLNWWDSIASEFRKDHEIQRVEIGRRGERLSYSYEYKRIGRAPHWISLEYNGVGYDIKSQVSSEDSAPLLIEVKTSQESWENALFHITRHEWDVLESENQAVLHLWSLSKNLCEHAVVPISLVAPHIPQNQGLGKWEMAMCPFSLFIPKAAAQNK